MTYWREITLGEIADAIATNLRHPVREWRRRRDRARLDAEYAVRFDAEVAAYIAAHPGTRWEWAAITVAQLRTNRAYARIVQGWAFARWASDAE